MVSVQATFAATLVDEWVHAGVTDAVICPGSRSTPMALALAARLQVHVRLDERSAGFFALGLSMATGRPTIICVTSGTAGAELHPAVVEAHQGKVALIVCTADRPPELHHVGASQTIDQVGLFTTSTRWACDPGVPEESQAERWRPLAARAFAEAQAGPLGPGPVHLNLAFRDPLVGEAGPLPSRPGPASVIRTAATFSLDAPLGGRGMIIAGANATDDPAQLLLLGARLGWPVLADPRSGCRVPGTIAAADAIVRAHARPDLPSTVVLLGAPWLSKALGEYVGKRRRRVRGSLPSIPGGGGRTPPWSSASSTMSRERAGSRRRWSRPLLPPPALWVAPVKQALSTWHGSRSGRPMRRRPKPPSSRPSGRGSTNRSWPASWRATRRRTISSSWCRPPCRCAISNGSPRRSRSHRP